MIYYHGAPITPDKAAVDILSGRHALVSFAYPKQLALIADLVQSFVLDNGAFSAWKRQILLDLDGYYAWIALWRRHPGFDWCLIPDVIDGGEAENDALIDQWPFHTSVGVPVFHLHESLDRLQRLTYRFPRVALGSSGEFSSICSAKWWGRMAEIMACVCDAHGTPDVKLHGLRMLNAKVLTRLPLASADSSTVARNIGLDVHWQGRYAPINKGARGVLMANRIEAVAGATAWCVEGAIA